MKGVGLWDERCRFMGCVGLWDEGENTIRTLLYQHLNKTKNRFFQSKGVGLWDKRCRYH